MSQITAYLIETKRSYATINSRSYFGGLFVPCKLERATAELLDLSPWSPNSFWW
jgi:hypothetical protein